MRRGSLAARVAGAGRDAPPRSSGPDLRLGGGRRPVHVTAASRAGVRRLAGRSGLHAAGAPRARLRERAVYEVSKLLLDSGARACLFTDQANPTSNKIYEALGYERLVDMANLRVE